MTSTNLMEDEGSVFDEPNNEGVEVAVEERGGRKEAHVLLVVFVLAV